MKSNGNRVEVKITFLKKIEHFIKNLLETYRNYENKHYVVIIVGTAFLGASVLDFIYPDFKFIFEIPLKIVEFVSALILMILLTIWIKKKFFTKPIILL